MFIIEFLCESKSDSFGFKAETDANEERIRTIEKCFGNDGEVN